MSDYRKIKDEEWVRRGDVHTMLVDLPETATMTEVIFRLHNIPAVPREMSAREYVKARSRMCDAQYELFGSDEHDMTVCIECPLEDYCEGVKKDAEAEVAIVEKWVREHPEERSEE